MERLWVVRHGKAERDSATGRDFDRVLRDRGRRQAAWLGELLAGGVGPGAVVTSPAARASETADLIASALGLEARRDERLGLDTDVGTAIEMCRESAGDGLLIVGHNPTFSAIASVLAFGVGAGGVGLRTGQCAELVPRAGAGDPWAPGAWVLEGIHRLEEG